MLTTAAAGVLEGRKHLYLPQAESQDTYATIFTSRLVMRDCTRLTLSALEP